jgi:hypothetical protein
VLVNRACGRCLTNCTAMLEGFTRVTSALTAVARRLDDVDNGIRPADRLSAIEQRLSDLEGRRES